jgi:hypothetical protein
MSNTKLSAELNAEELAYKWTDDPVMASGYAAAIREVAQPIADERDELREAVEVICKQGGVLVSKQLAACQAILAKYPK